ncbi:MAG TPA: barstar family protein [Chloroflexi bacterium]|nr:barstar family protein [Chloroflexota bacterium]
MNRRYAELLAQTPSGLYRWLPPVEMLALAEGVEQLGWRLFQLDGRRARDKASFLQAAAAVMHFPDYFGRNWDAFEECINDLSWAPAHGYVLVYEHVWWLACEQPAAWRMARAILQDACRNRASQATPFLVLLRQTHGCSGVDAVLRLRV